jgi:Cu+-exporting ATPase
LLTENGLGDFYRLSATAGVRINGQGRKDRFAYLDEPLIRDRLVNFSNERLTRVTFRIPSIHCIACVWLLENLFRLEPRIGESRVNFSRKEMDVAFQTQEIKLSEVVALLAKLGYEPELNLSDLEEASTTDEPSAARRRLWLQVGVAGFAFGNIMLFSVASYLGLDSFSGPAFKRLVGYLSIALALPVVTFSALDYWRTAWTSLRQKLLAIEVPIALGIVAIFAQSTYEVLSGQGEGYFDSLTGLIFFLLCGRLFQQKTFDRLAFDRDYTCFFPLSCTRVNASGEETAALAQVKVGDVLLIRHGELIPADGTLISGDAVIDYSFVTGESQPVEKQPGNHVYAGGRQIAGEMRIRIVKPVSQSYLTSLWNQESFRKVRSETLHTLINVFSYRFTRIVIAIALGSALFWAYVDPGRSLKAFTSVLIVACPCALALAAPFTLGTAQRVLGRRKIYLKSPQVIETLAKVNTVVFDKTGTLTAVQAATVVFEGTQLSSTEASWISSLARESTHPYAVRISEWLQDAARRQPVRSFIERLGCGMRGTVSGHEIVMGSAAWLASCNVTTDSTSTGGSVVHVACDGAYRGIFVLTNALRPATDRLITELGAHYDLALLSGDSEHDRTRFRGLFGMSANLRFRQSPADKLAFVRDAQSDGKTVLMVGDGLNDAGAFSQSDVGVAVVEKIGAFSPASDVIMSGAMVPQLGALLRFSLQSVQTVRLSFMISSLYNIIGISIAASGNLAPIVCAIVMPISSISVVAFACAMTNWLGRKAFAG